MNEKGFGLSGPTISLVTDGIVWRICGKQKGLPLGAVNLLVLPVVVGCTSLVTALGVTSLAAHTIIKQVCDFQFLCLLSLRLMYQTNRKIRAACDYPLYIPEAVSVFLQVWDFWTQVSQCLNIAANSMVASALGEVRLFDPSVAVSKRSIC